MLGISGTVRNSRFKGVPMEKKKSVLEDLFLDEDKVTDELVKELLTPYVGLSKTEDKIVAKSEFTELPQPRRLLLYLLSRHAMVRLQIPNASLAASAEKVAESCLVPVKASREILSKLKAAGFLSKNKDGYFIPVPSLLRVASELRKGKRGK
jgi:hypothetical protein